MARFKSKKEKDILCICPKCNKKHFKTIYWTGNCIPRIFCDDHRQQAKSDNLEIFNNNLDKEEEIQLELKDLYILEIVDKIQYIRTCPGNNF